MIAQILFCLLPVVFVDAIGSNQAIAAQGRLFCHDKPAAQVLVKLYDVDEPDMDDLIAKTYTDENGKFFLSGYETELTKIDPKLNIYTDCDDSLPCQRKISIKIPDKYITEGTTAKNVFDAGELNLAGRWKGEERDCFHFMRISNQIKLQSTNSTDKPVEEPAAQDVYETTYSYE